MLGSCAGVLGWDERTYMPRKARPIAASRWRCWPADPRDDDRPGHRRAAGRGRGLRPGRATRTSDAAVNVREIRRAYDRAVKLPNELVEELARVTTPRPAGLAGGPAGQRLRRVPAVAGKDRRAEARGGAGRRLQGRALRRPAGRVRAGRAPRRRSRTSSPPCARTGAAGRGHRGFGPQGRSATSWSANIRSSGSRSFGQAAAAAIGFDFEAGRLDVTTHPFCSGIGPGDCRITTRYNPRHFNEAFFGILHEAGHGIYEQGLPAEHFGTPLRHGRVAGHPRIAIAPVGEPGRPRPAVLGALLPAAQADVPEALRDVTLGRFLFRHQRRAAVVHPRRGGRGDLQPAHHPALRAGAGAGQRRPEAGRRAGGVEREVPADRSA